MSYLDNLLEGVRVEWMALGEISELIRGNGLQKKDFTETGVPAIHYGQIYTYYGLSTTQTKSFVSPELAKTLRKVDTGNVVITNTSENLEDVGKALVYLGKIPAVTGGHATIIKPGDLLLGKYFAYFSQTEEFASQKKKYAKGTKVIDVSATDMSKILIPIPSPDDPKKSLQIQAEIVRLLDIFATLTIELTTELTTELAAREKQYNYYRHQLLTFGESDVSWKPLGEIGEFTYGYAAKAKDLGNARFVRITDINIYGKLIPADVKYVDISEENERYLLKKNDILMARTGATYGKTMIFEEDYPAIYAGFLIKLSFDKILNPKYYWHFAQSSLFWDQANKLVSGGGQPQFNANALKQVKIPIPFPDSPIKSLKVQAEIVNTLDKFDSLTSLIREYLPKEIELRKKQFEYYRKVLLTFPTDNLNT